MFFIIYKTSMNTKITLFKVRKIKSFKLDFCKVLFGDLYLSWFGDAATGRDTDGQDCALFVTLLYSHPLITTGQLGSLFAAWHLFPNICTFSWHCMYIIAQTLVSGFEICRHVCLYMCVCDSPCFWSAERILWRCWRPDWLCPDPPS